jgi:hypothetical protein
MKQTSFLDAPEVQVRHVDRGVSLAAKRLRKARERAEQERLRTEAGLPDWHTRAVQMVKAYVDAHPRKVFLTEDVRKWAGGYGFDDPADGRDWGHVMVSAHKAGHIEPRGYKAARSSNGSPKRAWKRKPHFPG